MLPDLLALQNRLLTLLDNNNRLLMSEQAINALLTAEYKQIEQQNITADYLHEKLIIFQQRINDYRHKKSFIGFGWKTSFYDLLGLNHDILLLDVFTELFTLTIKQWLYSCCLDAITSSPEIASLRTELIEARLNKALTALQQAKANGRMAKILYKISWAVYLVEAFLTFLLCNTHYFMDPGSQTICHTLHAGPVPFLLTIGAAIGWLSWGIFAAPYYMQRIKGFRQEKSALAVLSTTT